MSAGLHITRKPGTTGPSPEDFLRWAHMDQMLRYEPGNGCWYGRFTEVSYFGDTELIHQASFSTIHPEEEDAIPEVCELATAFWARWGGELSGDDRCAYYIARKLSAHTPGKY